MRLKIILFSLILLQSFQVLSQDKSDKKTKETFWENVRFGGGFQLAIGYYRTTLGISPSAAYGFSDQFAIGVASTYLYSKQRSQDLSYHLFGGSTFALYNPIEQIQLSTEFEMLNVNTIVLDNRESYWQPAWYVGLGYGVGNHSAIGVRYNILFDKEQSINNSAFTPFIRIFF